MRERLAKTEFECDEDQYNIWCRLCQDILVDGTSCKKCKLLFCHQCFEGYLELNGQRCPNCRETDVRGGACRKKALKCLYFRCLNLDNGCDSLLNYMKLFAHD